MRLSQTSSQITKLSSYNEYSPLRGAEQAAFRKNAILAPQAIPAPGGGTQDGYKGTFRQIGTLRQEVNGEAQPIHHSGGEGEAKEVGLPSQRAQFRLRSFLCTKVKSLCLRRASAGFHKERVNSGAARSNYGLRLSHQDVSTQKARVDTSRRGTPRPCSNCKHLVANQVIGNHSDQREVTIPHPARAHIE